MTNEDMILLNQDIFRIHNARNELESDYVLMQIELPSGWHDSELKQARQFRDWLALEAFPETAADYKNQIEQLKTENERLRKAYDEIKGQNEKLAIRLFEKTEV